MKIHKFKMKNTPMRKMRVRIDTSEIKNVLTSIVSSVSQKKAAPQPQMKFRNPITTMINAVNSLTNQSRKRYIPSTYKEIKPNIQD